MKVTTRPCVFCQSRKTINVNRGKYEAYMRGMLYAQDLGLSVDDAERLISGTCPRCWDEQMGGDDE